MVRFALLAGAFVAPMTAITVYLDSARRSRPTHSRIAWAGMVGFASLVGFLLPTLFAGTLHRVFLRLVHRSLVVVTPYEILLFDVGVGVAVTGLAVAVYVTTAVVGVGYPRSVRPHR